MATTTHWNAVADFPAQGLPRDKLGFATKVATSTMPPRPRQTWRFQISDQYLVLFAAPPPPDTDSDLIEREAMIDCGIVLQHLKLTLKRHRCFGREALFPDLAQPNLAARVYVGSSGARDTHDQQLADAIAAEPHESKRLDTPASDAALDCLSLAAAGERSWLELARSESSRQLLQNLIKAEDRQQPKEIRFQNETLIRTPAGSWESAGFTATTLHDRFSWWRKPAATIKPRPPTQPAVVPPARGGSVASDASFAVIKTKTDDRHGWLAAGQMLARLLLHARTLGLSCNPVLNVLRRPELRTELRTAIGHKGFTQVIVQFAGLQPAPNLSSDAFHAPTATGNSP